MTPTMKQLLEREIAERETSIHNANAHIRRVQDEIAQLQEEVQLRKYMLGAANTLIEHATPPLETVFPSLSISGA